MPLHSANSSIICVILSRTQLCLRNTNTKTGNMDGMAKPGKETQLSKEAVKNQTKESAVSKFQRKSAKIVYLLLHFNLKSKFTVK
jgi:magnesium-transporting ATPase (P-type)